MCEKCFSQLDDLRRSRESAFYFFSDNTNFPNATSAAKTYISKILEQQHPIIEKIISEREESRIIAQAQRQIEQDKQEYARAIIGLYEYDIVTILNKGHGRIDREQMMEILSSHARDGWKLHTIYSNELGKNAISLLGFNLNETACEDVLIFERKLRDDTALGI